MSRTLTPAAPVAAFLQAVETADMTPLDAVLGDAVVLDATVPNWRFTVRGRDAVRSELGRWYADPGRLEEVRRLPLPGGELVEFVLSWTEEGVPHACHQAHVLTLTDGRIVADTAFCGGRWPAALLAEMEAAAQAAG